MTQPNIIKKDNVAKILDRYRGPGVSMHVDWAWTICPSPDRLPQFWVEWYTETVKALAETKVGTMLDQVDAELARGGGSWLLGDRFSLVDPYLFTLCRWTRGFARPAHDLPHIRPWLDRMLARPAPQRAFASEQLAAPFV